MKLSSLTLALLGAATLCGCYLFSPRTPKVWQAVIPGMDRDTVQSMLGRPDVPPINPHHEVWFTRKWEFHVFYDTSDLVTNFTQLYLLR